MEMQRFWLKLGSLERACQAAPSAVPSSVIGGATKSCLNSVSTTRG